jgi:uncharacterized membrane protein (DUF2068 family)
MSASARCVQRSKHMAHRRDVIIQLIGVFKLLKAAMLLALGLGALSMRHQHSWLNTWVHAVAADPHGRYVAELLAKITSFHVRQLVEIGVGSLVYASVFMTEGIGLILRKGWAEVLTVFITISFIPLEVYEMVEHASWAKIVVIIVNVAIVIYLVRRLRREGHWPFHRRSKLAARLGALR